MEATTGKAKRRTRKIKMYIQDFTEAEWDEESKSIYLLFCFFLFSKSSFHVLQSKSCFFVFVLFCLNSPPTQVIFSFSIFFFLFLLLLFCFPVCNNISLRGKKRKKLLFTVLLK